MLLSTDARPNASRTQLDSQEAIAQAQASHQLHTSLAETAQKHKAELKAQPEPAKLPAVEQQARSLDTQQTQDQGVTAYSEPLLQLSGASGITTATPESGVFSAGNTSSITAGQAINLAAQGNSHHLVKDGISFFTYGKVSNASQPNQEVGIALHAASGKVSSQSQSGQTRLTADQGLTVASATASIQIAAKTHVLLTAGGAGLRIEGGNITLQGPGTMEFKGSAVELAGPGSVGSALPKLPQIELVLPHENAPNSLQVNLADLLGADPDSSQTIAGVAYEFRTRDGKVLAAGTTNSQGYTARFYTHEPQDVVLYVGDGAHLSSMEVEHSAPPQGN
jgi:type VI secretion system secreted protein VgrG